MTEEEMEKMTVDDWMKYFEQAEKQPRAVDLKKDISDDEREAETGTGTVNLFKD